MNVKPILTEADYHHALKRVNSLMDAELGTPKGDELDILAMLIEKYEEEKFPIHPPDPTSATK